MSEIYSERAHKQLLIESWSNSARELLIRGYTTGGPFAESHTTNADRSRASDLYELHGFPEGVQISPLVAPVRRGECYIRLTLMMDGEPVLRMSAAYLTDLQTISWPNGVFEESTDGQGLVRTITGSNPAAGAGITETVPTNARWKFLGVRATFVADATVITRDNKIQFNNGVTTIFEVEAGGITASQTKNIAFAPGYTDDSAGSNYHSNTPEILLFQGWGFTMTPGGIQAGDDWGSPTIIVEEWIEE